MATYERYLSNLVSKAGTSTMSPEFIQNIVESKLNDHEASQMIIQLQGKPIKVRKQGERVIKFILWSKDLVSAATSTQPYAALAWSGVSILLSVRFLPRVKLSRSLLNRSLVDP